jgi:hypothetical protein
MRFFRKRKKAMDKETESSNPKKEMTRVTIRYNVGYSNHLFIRGNGAGLSWTHGRMLKNIGPDEWVWETNVPFSDCEFKVLINDRHFESGENHHIHEGIVLQYTPKF